MAENKNPLTTEHPAPGASPLWDHLDTILSMRRGRKTWRNIADHLKTQGVKTSVSTVHGFVKRYAERLKKGKPPTPLGYALESPSPATPPNSPPYHDTPEKDADPLSTDVREVPEDDPFYKFNKKQKQQLS